MCEFVGGLEASSQPAIDERERDEKSSLKLNAKKG